MKRLALIGVLFATMLFPGAASAASLVPLAENSEWGTEPIFVTAPPGDQRVFVVERGSASEPGAIRVIEGGNLKPAPFLTIGGISTNSERGFLSMAFSPRYATNGLFYVFYTAGPPTTGEIRIVEYRRSDTDPNLADASSARPVLTTPHSAGNHNGGWMAFGPDGLLYITIGDNGQRTNAESASNVFGKVLRIDPTDPDAGGPLTATIPADNPFVGVPAARGEVYTIGLRNPFRASFAPDGDLTIGDVGEGTTEEINAGDLAGKNMGWPTCEGFCDPSRPGLTDPVFEYPNAGSTDCAVAGGNVVRDPELTGLLGRYIYGDFCGDDLRTLNLKAPGGDPGPAGLEVGGARGGLRAFGEDARGCLYVATTATVFRVAPNAASAKDCPHTAPPPPPPDPDDLPDVTFNSYIPAKRPLALKIRVAGKCSIACDLTASGIIRIGRNRSSRKVRRIKLMPTSKAAAANVRTPLVLRIPARRISKVRKAARKGSRIVATVRVNAVATDGSGGSGRSQIRLVPRKRR